MFYTVYKTTNKINSKFYIGAHQTNNLEDNYIGSGVLLKKAIQKYGIENFSKEILYVVDSAEEMYAKEAELVTLSEESYNLKSGGQGGRRQENNASHSQNHMDMMNRRRYEKYEKYPNYKNEVYGKIKNSLIDTCNTKEHKEMMSKVNVRAMLGRHHTEEAKRKISISSSMANRGDNNPMSGRMWITNGNESLLIAKHGTIPTGWRAGSSKHLKKGSMMWITNGIEEKFIRVENEIPSGWRKGMLFARNKKN